MEKMSEEQRTSDTNIAEQPPESAAGMDFNRHLLQNKVQMIILS